jgi:transposase-like protein
MDPQQQFCPNMACPARGKTGEKHIVVHSRKPERYKCTVCQKTFSAKVGTPFYRLHHSADLITIVMTLIAFGCPVQAVVAAYGLDERTVMVWQQRSGEHCQRVHTHLVLRPRDLISEIVQLVRETALARPLLICVDGLRTYISAIQNVFRSPLPARTRGRRRMIAWPDIHIGRVIKQYQGKRVVDVIRRMAQGSEKAAKALLAKSHGGTKLNTAYIERLNATFRSRLASLARRSRALLKNPETLTPLVYLMGSVYNFCSEHKSLRLKLWVGERGFR